MELRPFFLLGDVVADPSWNMWVAHGVCMVMGMVLAFPLALPFMVFFGAAAAGVLEHVQLAAGFQLRGVKRVHLDVVKTIHAVA